MTARATIRPAPHRIRREAEPPRRGWERGSARRPTTGGGRVHPSRDLLPPPPPRRVSGEPPRGSWRPLEAILLAAWATAAAAPGASAHDLWIEPSTFTPRAGEPVAVSLRIGDVEDGIQEVARRPARIERFEALAPGGTARELPGVGGVAPAGLLDAAEPGLTTLVYVNNPSRITLSAEAFSRYLRSEGLHRAPAARREHGLEDSPGREAFSRSLKSLVLGASTETPAPRMDDAGPRDRPLGLPLELVLEGDLAAGPETPAASSERSLRLLFRGEPVEGALVEAAPLGDLAAPLQARSDAAGRVRLPLDRNGAWLVTAVWIEAAPPGAEVDWRSYWTSLTFHLADG